MAGFIQDSFTQKLLLVITELAKAAAMPRKGTFAQGLGMTHSDMNKIERGERNVKDELHSTIKNYLAEHYGVSRSWWNSIPKTPVAFDFKPAARTISLNKMVKIDFLTLQKYESMEKELEECRQKVAELQGISIAAEPKVKYNPDTNPDKTKEK